MTKEELLKRLAECRGEGPEEGHMEADKALLDYINDKDILDAFTKLPKWYS